MIRLRLGCLLFTQKIRHHRLVKACHARTLSSKSTSSTNFLINYFHSLKWVPIPVGVGFAYVGYQQYGHIKKREQHIIQHSESPEDILAKDWQVKLYTALPLKAMSRLWGYVNSFELPLWLRSPVFKLYIKMFDCNLEEAEIKDLTHYRNLGEFFKRRLRPDCRPINQEYSVTSPADGKVLHFGKVEKGLVEQVKGVTYSLQEFLGPVTWKDPNNNLMVDNRSPDTYHNSVKARPDTDLYHCVIYLAPGDYHGFHSPAEWMILYRRHFPGELLSVQPGLARWIKGLFNLNERAIYFGQWEHGFFAFAAVGATNVGSIKVYCDKALETNSAKHLSQGKYFDETFCCADSVGVPMTKGQSLGEFNLGSTIVLIFEAPKSFRFILKTGQKIKFGEPIGCYKCN